MMAIFAAVVVWSWSTDALAGGNWLVVDTVSNLTPGVQLAAVRLTVEAPDECGNNRHVRIIPGAGKNWARSVRLADLPRLRDGIKDITIQALDPAGNVLVSRSASIELKGGKRFGMQFVLNGTPCSGAGCPRPPADPVIPGITLLMRTGGDDLRGGDDNVNATVGFSDGTTQTFYNVNRGRRWADQCTTSVYLRFTTPVPRGRIAWMRLTTTSGGGIGGDNWNLDALTVQDERNGLVLYARSGSPLKRFTGEAPYMRLGL